jgi:GTP cyclohydrolase I
MSQISKYKITWEMFHNFCELLAIDIKKSRLKFDGIFGIPKNGIYIAIQLSKHLKLPIVYDLNEAIYNEKILIVDDLIDSGRTLSGFPRNFCKAVLFVKNHNDNLIDFFVSHKSSDWIEFPWEKSNEIEDLIVRQLEYIGENPTREGLLNTPRRVVNSWNELYAGYKMDIEGIFTTFQDGACDEMVILKDCEFYSTCEHHLLPFNGKINIGYIPDGKVIGISKLARLVDIFSRRLQIQEKMTGQIADVIWTKLNPKGVIVTCEAQHLCMTSRGIKKQSSKMITSAIRGVFQENQARQEFLNLIK